jgi:hypothetical protein
MSSFVDEFDRLFDPLSTVVSVDVRTELVRRSRDGILCTPENRCLIWRCLLGVLPGEKSLWASQLNRSVEEYYMLRDAVFPSITKTFDPLSESPETRSYFDDIEKTKFIQGDLDRLYMNGIDDQYFQNAKRGKLLLSVLFLW